MDLVRSPGWEARSSAAGRRHRLVAASLADVLVKQAQRWIAAAGTGEAGSAAAAFASTCTAGPTLGRPGATCCRPCLRRQ